MRPEFRSSKEEFGAEMEQVRMQAELASLRAVERLREQHEAALNRARELADADRDQEKIIRKS